MVELNASGQSALGNEAQGRDGELIKLVVVSCALAVVRRFHVRGEGLDSCSCTLPTLTPVLVEL